jgi:large subunit ribosomal protein L32
MGLPGHRRTSSHKRRRAAHFALTEQTLQKCPKCGKPIMPHRACQNCGMYKGRQVLKVRKIKTTA